MKKEEVINAVNDGKVVCWSNDNYIVENTGNGVYMIVCYLNGSNMMLSLDAEGLDCKDFFVLDF